MKEIALAPADRRDRGQLLELLHMQLVEHHVAVSSSRLAAAVDAVLDDPRLGFFHVARAGSTVVGVANVSYAWALEHFGKTAWIDELYVDPEYRGEGVGRELLLATMERARRDGCRAVDIEIDDDHMRSESLYVREGFSRLPRTRFAKKLAE